MVGQAPERRTSFERLVSNAAEENSGAGEGLLLRKGGPTQS